MPRARAWALSNKASPGRMRTESRCRGSSIDCSMGAFAAWAVSDPSAAAITRLSQTEGVMSWSAAATPTRRLVSGETLAVSAWGPTMLYSSDGRSLVFACP